MSERGRINRALQSSAMSLSEMRSTRNPHKQQEAWENFLIHWRRCIELLNNYCLSNNMKHIKERRYNDRMASSILNYAWEARNAEAHDPLGSADAQDGSIKINQLDRSKPLYIDNFQMIGGNIVNLKMDNGVSCIEEGRLEIKPIIMKGGKVSVDPPTNTSPLEICVTSLNFADDYQKEVFK